MIRDSSSGKYLKGNSTTLEQVKVMHSKGMTDKQIARKLKLRAETVGKHRHSLKLKSNNITTTFYSDAGQKFKSVKEALLNLLDGPDRLWLYQIIDGQRVDHTQLRKVDGVYKRVNA